MRMAVSALGLASTLACGSNRGADCHEDSDGREVCRLTSSAEQAFQQRGTEPEPLSREEWGRACVISGGCTPLAADGGDDVAATRSQYTTSCTADPNASEAAVIPMRLLDSTFGWVADERWTYFARAIEPLGGDCAAVRAALTEPAPRVLCTEAGCDWNESGNVAPPLVRCDGDVATLLTSDGPVVRNCATAFARCDDTSRTGCTDRRPTSCSRGDFARCDGDIVLGCEDEKVTFIDCSRHAGVCAEHALGANCVYPDAGECSATDERCDGDSIELCVQGNPIAFDCSDLGYVGCVETAWGPHCSPEG